MPALTPATIRLSSATPKIWEEGTIGDTSYPGTIMEMTPATPLTNGRATFRHSTKTTGSARGICVLLEDNPQGFLPGVAYVAGKRGFLYWPEPGEELNLILGDLGGTAGAVTQGDLFGVNSTAGTLIANSSYASAPFQSMETLTAVGGSPVEYLWVKFLGHAVGT